MKTLKKCVHCGKRKLSYSAKAIFCSKECEEADKLIYPTLHDEQLFKNIKKINMSNPFIA